MEKKRSSIIKNSKIQLILISCFFVIIYFVGMLNMAHSDVSDEIKRPVTIIDKELRDEYFEIGDGRTIVVKLFMSFEVDELHKDHGRIISANPCVSAETYKKIHKLKLPQVKPALERYHDEIVTASKACIRRLMKADVSDLIIEYLEIIDKGFNYERPRLPDAPEKPMTIEEFEAWEKTLE